MQSLLFISYKFVKGFFAITLLLLLISSWNFHDVCQRFLCNQKRNFSLIRQKMRNFRGSMGKIFVFCRIQLKFHFWLYKKRWHTPWKFQFEKTRNKKSYRQKAFDKLIWNEQYVISPSNSHNFANNVTLCSKVYVTSPSIYGITSTCKKWC